MKNAFIFAIAIGFVIDFSACIRPPEQEQKAGTEMPKIESDKIGKPIVEEKLIMANFQTFWAYYTTNIKFFEDFVPFDTAGHVISKGDFLQALTTAKYYPLMIYSKDSLINYKLAKMPAKEPENAGAYMRQDSRNALAHYKMEGKPIPALIFTM